MKRRVGLVSVVMVVAVTLVVDGSTFVDARVSAVTSGLNTKAKPASSCPTYRATKRGSIPSSLRELSGWALSKRHPNVLWGHNDSGDGARLIAVSTTDASAVADVDVDGTAATDWEDVATYRDRQGRHWIVVADTGDNVEQRDSVRLVFVPEPKLSARRAPAAWDVTVTWANGPHDVEALIMDPRSGDAILIGKRFAGAAEVSVDVVPASAMVPGGRVTSTKVGVLSIPGGQPYGPTGASISPDGTAIALVFYANLTLVWKRVSGASVADTILSAVACRIGTGFGQYEAVAIDDRGTVFVATEGSSVPMRAYQRVR